MSELDSQSIIRKKRRMGENRISRVFDHVLERKFKERTENELRTLRIYQQKMAFYTCQLFKIYITTKSSHGKLVNETIER